MEGKIFAPKFGRRPLILDRNRVVIKSARDLKNSGSKPINQSVMTTDCVSSEEDSFDERNPSGKHISKAISKLSFTMELCPTQRDPEYYVRNRYLSREDFRHAVNVYTNNQDYFLEIKDYQSLNGLEHWFLHIIEPIPNTTEHADHFEWLEREITKRSGYSYSCSQEAKKKITPKKEDLQACFRDLATTRTIFDLLKKKYGWNKKKNSC